MTIRSTQYVPPLNILTQSVSFMPEMEIRLISQGGDHTIDVYDREAEDVVETFDFNTARQAATYAKSLKTELRGIGHKVRVVN